MTVICNILRKGWLFMKETVLKIKGMHCMGCVLGLEENLENLDFIDKAEGNLEENSVKIQYKDELDK